MDWQTRSYRVRVHRSCKMKTTLTSSGGSKPTPGVCCRHIVETQGARAIAGLLISRLAIPVAAAPLVLPISFELSVKLRDDTGCPHPAWVIQDADTSADADGIALVSRANSPGTLRTRNQNPFSL